jgi:hypothetical protein
VIGALGPRVRHSKPAINGDGVSFLASRFPERQMVDPSLGLASTAPIAGACDSRWKLLKHVLMRHFTTSVVATDGVDAPYGRTESSAFFNSLSRVVRPPIAVTVDIGVRDCLGSHFRVAQRVAGLRDRRKVATRHREAGRCGWIRMAFVSVNAGWRLVFRPVEVEKLCRDIV